MKELVATLLVWIAANSLYDATAMPAPEVTVVTPTTLTATFYARSNAQAPIHSPDKRLTDFYDPSDGPSGRIYLHAPAGEPDIKDPIFQERLLHQLVHHARSASGRPDHRPCAVASVVEAYTLGTLFLEGARKGARMPARNFWSRYYARCKLHR